MAVFGDGEGLEDVEVECAFVGERVSHFIIYEGKKDGWTWRWC